MKEELKEQIIQYIENNQPGIYWDYQSELDKENIAKIMDSEDGLSDVECDILEMNENYIFEQEQDFLTELYSKFRNELDADYTSEDFIYDFGDYVSINSNIELLLRRTGEKIFFYETGITLPESWNLSAIEIKKEINKIKSALSIPSKVKQFDNNINEMLLNASYGGSLVVYFMTDVEQARKMKFENLGNHIRFSGYVNIAIIDTYGGSGCETQIKHTFALPFEPDNMYYEESIKYNFSFAVCGMVSDWCESTKFEMFNKKVYKKPNNNMSAALKKDKAFAEHFKKTGKCIFLDMDMNRHNNVYYINDFPCGHKCKDCGTFWVD